MSDEMQYQNLPVSLRHGGHLVGGVLYRVFEKVEAPYVSKTGDTVPSSRHWCLEIRSKYDNEHGLECQATHHVYFNKDQIKRRLPDNFNAFVGHFMFLPVFTGGFSKVFLTADLPLDLKKMT